MATDNIRRHHRKRSGKFERTHRDIIQRLRHRHHGSNTVIIHIYYRAAYLRTYRKIPFYILHGNDGPGVLTII